ncbi:hypothetical protein HFN60_02370 [Rhizobium leguminosarum]|uniref:hypothetical protein n=1 Tax=Rhizobium leguminosarum TaxID=384 RepID=UPI001C980F99|nr:hypothetical protein [Rhizobium leguminosarum]MBY5814506.1 hypothetical protein [Rhizobium leguminosarum]
MTNLAAIAIFATISTVSLSGISHAESLEMNSGPQIEKTLQDYSKPFAVKYLGNYDDNKIKISDGADAENPRTAAGVKHIQASINANKGLVEKLRTRGVDVKDIVNAEEAADGSIIFSVN